ncbi:MAG: hypothetical protein HZA54_14195, partial [Planctomycetes bacterium]|nr:hypothetical protein [Planctomycetota bacterium]
HSFVEDALLGAGSACRDYFDPAALAGLVREHAEGRDDHHRILFALLSFEVWHGLFIGNQGSAGNPSQTERTLGEGRNTRGRANG